MSAPLRSLPQRLPGAAPLSAELAAAERYRFLRRILLRAAPTRNTTGSVTYLLELETPEPIDFEELDRIVDACAADDDGVRTAFSRGGPGAHRLAGGLAAPVRVVAKSAVVRELRALRAPRAPRAPAEPLPPIVCRCGAVRPKKRGTRPLHWSCGACPS